MTLFHNDLLSSCLFSLFYPTVFPQEILRQLSSWMCSTYKKGPESKVLWTESSFFRKTVKIQEFYFCKKRNKNKEVAFLMSSKKKWGKLQITPWISNKSWPPPTPWQMLTPTSDQLDIRERAVKVLYKQVRGRGF